MNDKFPLPQRVPKNAPGDFYVEAGLCTRCCLVHGEAPDLLNDPDEPFEECFFRRQPRNPEEVDAAISAMTVSEMAALRYGGIDPAIIAKLGGWNCDHAGVDARGNVVCNRHTDESPAQKPRRWWWQRLFGIRRKGK